MNRREVVRAALAFDTPPYVPWSFGFTHEAQQKLTAHYGRRDLEPVLQNHMMQFGNAGPEPFREVEPDKYEDIFGVIWDRSVDKDIGVVCNCLLPEPDLDNLKLPDPLDPKWFGGIPEALDRHPDQYRIFGIGFSLYERAWTLRGMTRLMMDFYDQPDFVRALLRAIADFNIAQVEEAMKYDFDAVYFGDDWGQQTGLQMGVGIWREFIKPELKRMYGAVHDHGRKVLIHSCGKVDELFDDLVEIGLNCFNPFQPEVMDVFELLPRYHGRLAFNGGLSTQQTLPYGSADDVREETRRLLDAGRRGGYILAPAHAVEGDVPLENMLAFIDEVQQQDGAPKPA